MGELESLLLILAALYLTECGAWIRRGAVAFRSFGSKHWQVKHPEGPLANQRGAVVVANPLPPLGPLIICGQCPFSLSAQGIYSYTAASLNPGWRASQPARFIRFTDIKSVAAAQKRILVNAQVFLDASSPTLALRWARLIQRLRDTPAAKRETQIRQFIAGGFDLKQLRWRLEDFATRTRVLRPLSHALLLFLFGIAPPLAWSYGLRHVGLFLLAALLAQTVSISLLFRRQHKALYPEAGDERFTRFLTMLLAPPTAIRAVDLLGRNLLEEFHPVAVANVLCRPERFREFARETLRDLRYPFFPTAPANDTAAAGTEEWFRREGIAAVEGIVRMAGLDPARLMAPAESSDPSHRSYCPRCGAQFVMAQGSCADCGGLPLLELK